MRKLKASFLAIVISFSSLALIENAFAILAPADVVVTSNSASGTSINSAAISISFSKVTGAVSYRAVATSSTKSHDSGAVTFPSTQATNTIIIGSLTGGTSYSVTVEAIDNNGASATSAAVSFVAKSIPDEPGISSAVKGVGQATLTWTAPANTGGLPLTGYTISASGTDYAAAASDTTKVISNLTPGGIYKFTISANNSLGSSTVASFAELQIPDKPATPAAPTLTKDGTSLTVTWTAPNDNGSTITKYTASITSDANSTTSKEVTGATTTTFTGVANGTYSAKVVATNAVGSSDSSSASGTQTIATSTLTANNPVFDPASVPNIAYGTSQSVAITVPSAGVVTLTGTSGICTVSGTGPFTVNGIAVGTCTLTATSPATGTYDAAFGTKSFNVTKATPTLTFATIADQSMPGPLTLSATVSPSASIAYTVSGSGVCALQGSNQVQFIAAGSCSATATVAATTNYNAVSVTRTFNINAASSGGSSGGGGGGGGGGGPKQTAAYFVIIDPSNSSTKYSKVACIDVYSTDLFPQFKGQGCSSDGSLINLLLTDGGVTVRVYDAGYGSNYRTYHGTVANDVFSLTDATFFPGTTRYAVTVPGAVQPAPTPTPIATPNPTPGNTPTPTPTPTPSSSSGGNSGTVNPAPTTSPSSASSVKPAVVTNYVTTVSGKASSLLLLSSKSTYSLSLKLGKSFQIKNSFVAKGTLVKLVLVTSDSKTFTLINRNFPKAAPLLTSVYKPAKVGTYTFKLSLGKSIKTITLKVTK